MDLSGVSTALLSACETGVGDIRRAPEEYAGLRSGFLVAGVRCVISTLWAVDDMSTALAVHESQRLAVERDLPLGRTIRLGQTWLRGSTAVELRSRVRAMRRTFEWYRWEDRKIRAALRRFDKQMKRLAPDSHPYASPVYWAPFVSWTRS